MSLEEKYPKEVKQILSKYPPEQKRSAVMPLLYLAQREEGYLTKAAMQDAANPMRIRAIKKLVARIHTELSAREIKSASA